MNRSWVTVAYALGVDVGTTYTAAAVWSGNTAETVTLGEHAQAVPSVLFRQDDGSFIVGAGAVAQSVADPSRGVRGFKTHMGEEQPLPVGGARYRAHELTGTLLRWILDTVQTERGEPPARVVLTHPAAWKAHRRDTLVEAAGIAGLSDVGLLPEPVAGATWFAAQTAAQPIPAGRTIGVYDLGGGTFDASVVMKTATGFEVCGVPSGIEDLGGRDFDFTLLSHVLRELGIDEPDESDPAVAVALADLQDKLVTAKEHLSTLTEVTVPVFLPGYTGRIAITRKRFERLIHDDVVRTVESFGQIIERAGVTPQQLETVVLVGGSSRIPLVTKLLEARLGVRVAGYGSYATYAVCLGAAIAAGPRITTAEPAPPLGGAGDVAAAPAPAPPRTLAARLDAAVSAVDAETGTPASVAVDLGATGLGGATDVTATTPEVIRFVPPQVTTAPGEVLRTREAPPNRRALVTTAAIAVVIVALIGAAAVLARRGGHTAAPPPAARTPTAAAGGPAAETPAGTATFTGALVTAPDGADEMRAVAARPNGDLVAAGTSVDQHPRAWLRRVGQPWQVVAVPAPATGGILDVVANGNQLLAAGWITAAGRQQPAVWQSTDGAAWKQVAVSAELTAAGLSKVVALSAAPADGYLAAVSDQRTDRDGDTVMFRSADGRTWRPVDTTGLNGAGAQDVSRIARPSAGGFAAVGAVLQGGHLVPAYWTSSDGARWQRVDRVPPGAPALWALHAQPDGTLLTCGDTGAGLDPATACWTLPAGGTAWQLFQVTPAAGSPVPVDLYAVTTTRDGVVAVGVGRQQSTVDSAQWTVQLAVNR